MIVTDEAPATKVAVFASTSAQCENLQTLLEKCGLSIVVSSDDSETFFKTLDRGSVDVLLVDIGTSEEEFEFIDQLMEYSDIPTLFNDSGEGINIASNSESWAKKMAEKIRAMAAKASGTAPKPAAEIPKKPAFLDTLKDNGSEAEDITDDPSESELDEFFAEHLHGVEESEQLADIETSNVHNLVPPTLEPMTLRSQRDMDVELELELGHAADQGAGEQNPLAAVELNVWVLGASLGGPQAVRQFLSSLDDELPVCFVLAQHIGANHISLLAEQLNKVTGFHVLPGTSGHVLQHHEVILTPADKQLTVTRDGILVLKPSAPAAIYSPSIDSVMSEVAKRFGPRSGTIVFSGMGDDGAKGCEEIAQHGGVVWAQDIASCVVSSMPDHARKTGKVSYSANPEKLAVHLSEYFDDDGNPVKH